MVGRNEAELDTIRSLDDYRRNVASAELPAVQADPFWVDAANIGSVVVHPVLGPIAADEAVDVVGSFLGSQREEQAAKVPSPRSSRTTRSEGRAPEVRRQVPGTTMTTDSAQRWSGSGPQESPRLRPCRADKVQV